MKKLVTVCWSYTVEVDVPQNVGLEELESFDSSEEIIDIATAAVKEAADNIHWKDGVITDVVDAE